MVSGGPGDGERILVVDDDPPLRRMLQRTLVAEGFEVTLAADDPRRWWQPSTRRPI